MNEEQLRSKKVGELREIAAAFGIADTGKMKKAEILEALLNFKQNESEISEQSIPSEPEQIPENNDFNLTNNDTDTSESDVFASAPEIVVSESQIPLCSPMDCKLPGFSVHGISQARILERVAISFSEGSSQSRD